MSSGGWHAITDQQVRSASRVENTPGPPSTSDSRHVLGAQSPSAPRPRPVRRRLLRLHRPVPGSGSAHEERRAVSRLRIVVADDERPARAFLLSLLRGYDDVEVVGEAANGAECVELIERLAPDLALLDLQMPELDGLGVVRLIRKDRLPLVAFVTAYDEYAVRAFEVNAIDYLLKPVDRARLRETLNRAHERLERRETREQAAERLKAAAADYDEATRPAWLERIPVRHRGAIVLVPVDQIVMVA